MRAELDLSRVRDRVLALRAMPDFATLEEQELALIAEGARLRRVFAGTELLRPDAPLRHVYVLVEGEVRARAGPRGPVQLGPGSAPGALPLFAGETRGVEVTATRECLVLELAADAFLARVDESFPITRATLRLMARAIVEATGHLPVPVGSTEDAPMGEWRDRPLTLIERVMLIRASALGENLDLDGVAELAREAEEVRIDAGARLWSLGDPSTFTVSVDYGKVACTNAEGRCVRVGAGFGLGILDALGGLPRSYDAVAETPVILQRIQQHAQLAVLETFPPLARQVRMRLARAVMELGAPGALERPGRF